MIRLLLLFSFIIILLTNLSAQKQSPDETSYSVISKQIEQRLLDKAGRDIEFKEYEAALKNYSALLRLYPADAGYNYAMAITLYSNFQQPKSIPYFEKAVYYEKDTAIEAYFFLAASLHLAGNYSKAEQCYKIYLSCLERHPSFLSKEDIGNSKKDISHRILMCENGKNLSASSSERSPLLKEGKKITLSYLGTDINTLSDDFGPVFSADDSTVFFTSRRMDIGDIYFSRFKNNSWTPAENIGWPINTDSYEAVVNCSPDGKRIYFYRSGIKEGSLYYSDFADGHWHFPQPLLNAVEAGSTFKDADIYSYTLTSSKNELYMISEKAGGLGGKDIYVSKRMSDSTWGPMENLGAPINSEYDETALSLSPDGNTMYFSSNGNKSIGGFDVFVSTKKDGRWTQPINLGIPINTPGDDLFFSFLHNSSKAVYSSSAYGGSNTRDLDIYTIDFCDDMAENTIRGITFGAASGTITVTDGILKSDTSRCIIKDGRYSLNLKSGRRYDFIFETEGCQPVRTEILVPAPNECKRYDIYQEITFTRPGDTLYIKSALIDAAYTAKNTDISGYSAMLQKADKTKLRSYSETRLLTYPAAAPKTKIAPLTFDTGLDKVNSKASLEKPSFDSGKSKTSEKPAKEPVKIFPEVSAASKAGTTLSFNGGLFDYNKSTIKETSKAELDKVLEILYKIKPENKIEISGYTDSIGEKQYNIALSKQRAESIAAYFVSKKIDRNKIIVIGYGDAKPIAPNKNPDGTDNPEGRAKNRRTEIVIK